MIATDAYPELDQAHIDALFAATRQALTDAYDAVARLAGAASPLSVAGELALFRFLPRRYLPRYDLAFARRFAAVLATVAWKLAEPDQVCSLACTAEDLALKYILDLARAGLPDPQFDDLADALFEDDAVLALWDDANDGSAPEANLAFADWFRPFSDRHHVHPFVQEDAAGFRLLWSETENPPDDLEDPTIEVFIALGEDWLDAPDQVTDQIPAILEETRAALFPDIDPRRLNGAQRERLFDSAADDVRLLLDVARRDISLAYDVWLLRDAAPGRPAARERLHAGLPLDEALSLRKLERMGEYRGVTDVALRVYPADHRF